MTELKLYYIAVVILFMVGFKLIGESFLSSSLRKQIGYRKDLAYRK